MATPDAIPVRRIIEAAAIQAGLTVEDLTTFPSLRARGVTQARQRAVMLARHLRPDRSWPALSRAFNREHGALYEAAGTAAARLVAGDPAEVAAVAEIAQALGVDARDIDLPGPRLRHLRRQLDLARAKIARLEREIAELEARL